MQPVAETKDDLRPQRAKPRPITYDEAARVRKPRRCYVPWERRGGALPCDLCMNQSFGRRTVECVAGEDPPVFRLRRRN